MKTQELALAILQVILDGLAIVLAGLLAYFLRFTPLVIQILPLDVDLPLAKFVPLLLGTTLFQLIVFGLLGLYKLESPLAVSRQFGLVFLGASLTLAAVAIWTTLSRQFFESRFIILVGWLLVIILVNVAHGLGQGLRRLAWSRFGFGLRRVFLVGRNNPGRNSEVARFLIKAQPHNFQVIASSAEVDLAQIQKFRASGQLDEVWLTDLNYQTNELRRLINFCQQFGVAFKLASGALEEFRLEPKILAGVLPVLEVKNTPLEGWGWLAKRSLDLALGLVIFLIGLPLALLTALAIKWDSPGPVLVRLRRIGQNGRPFFMYKFRSMVQDAHKFKPALITYSEREQPLFKMRDDPRITRVGRVLRRLRLDELPQILNVFKGEMSLVGPRPHEPEEVQRLQDWQKRVLSVPPGITGLSQISGSAQLSPRRESELDIYYLENWSLGLDISILVRTFWRLFKDPGAY